jgi:general secretion pathway protein J
VIWRQKGFTLLELLVSLAIFSVIYLVAYGTLSTILSGSQALKTEQKRWQQLDVVFTLMQEDLGFATERNIRDTNGYKIPALYGQPTDLRAESLPTLEFSRAGLRVLSADRETGERRVAYRLKDGALYREMWPTLDRKYDAKPVDDRLLTEVKEFDLRFLNREGEWLVSWPDERHQEEILPVAIDVTINTQEDGEINRKFLVNG